MRNKLLLIFVLLFSMPVLSSCTRYGTTSLEQYGEWNKDTSMDIIELFHNTLPSSEVVRDHGESYYYRTSQGLLGEPSFSVIIGIHFDDRGDYINAVQRYRYIESYYQSSEWTTIYVLQGSAESFHRYLDDCIEDGMNYCFEIIATNDLTCSVEVINAHVWDYYRDDILIDILMQYLGL